MPNNYFNISVEKEVTDTKLLAKTILNDGWVDSDTIIVCCSPDYSCIQSMVLQHKLSECNGNELHEMLFLECPYPVHSQVYNRESGKYEFFDKYLFDWTSKNIKKGTKYLFIDSGVIRGKNFTKLRAVLRNKLEPNEFRFSAVYVQDDAIFTPDYYVEKFNFEKDGGLLFSWENPANPNWNY